jgi:hypothetical protein
VKTKKTSLFLIPLVGEANDHIENFERLEAMIASPPGAIVFKLVGSGGISAGAALTYLDIAAGLPAELERAVISYSPMVASDFALWLGLASLRDIRPSAWVCVADKDAYRWFGPDEQRCFDIIHAHTSLELVKNRILSVSELRELLLIDTPFTESLDTGLKIKQEGGIAR